MDDLLVTGTIATMAGKQSARSAADCDVELHENWAVACKDGRITYVGARADYGNEAAKELTGQLITPGYVDAHNHLVYGGDRAFELGLKLAGKSYLEILAAGGGIRHTVNQTRAAGLDGLVAQTQSRLAAMRARGTTALEAKSGYGLNEETELAILGANAALAAEHDIPVVSTFLGAHAVPAELSADVYLDQVIDMLPAVSKQRIATYCDAFVEEGVFTVAHGEQLFDAAKAAGLGLRLHADEIVNTAGAELAARAGAISADHLLRISESGIEALADAGTIATLMPSVPLTLMQTEWAPAVAIRDAGVPIAIASDHNPNNPVTDMGLVAQLACYAMKLTPAQALTGVTWNAACALELESEVGSLEVGKRADILIHDVPDLDAWVYRLGQSSVQTVVSGGKIYAS